MWEADIGLSCNYRRITIDNVNSIKEALVEASKQLDNSTHHVIHIIHDGECKWDFLNGVYL